MKEIERAFRNIERQVQRRTQQFVRSGDIPFNDLERSLLRFLKNEYVEKGGRPTHLSAPATLHRDVMQQFGLNLPQYREIIGRLESFGIVDAPTIEADNGCLHISSEIVEVVRRIDEEYSPMSPHEYLNSLMNDHGEDFEVHREDGARSQERGLRNEESSGRAYIGFFAGTEIRVGDVLVGAISKDRLRVIDVSSDLIQGNVLQIKAFTESDAAHQSRIAQSAGNSIRIETMTNSAIQQASPGAVQSLSFTYEKRNDLREIVEAIVTAVDQLNLNDEEQTDLVADAESIEAQLKKSKPNPSLIQGCLEGMKTTLTKAASAAATSGAAALANGLIERIVTYLNG